MTTRSSGAGALPLTAQRERYLRLMSSGMSNAQACRAVGVHRRTGMRWRHGRTVNTRHGPIHYAPISLPKKISARYLSEDERIMIADGVRAGLGVREIAIQLGRSPSTISRELRRNRTPASNSYRPHDAGKRAAARRARPKPGKLTEDSPLRDYVRDGLGKKWSPEQIAGSLTIEHGGDPSMQICHETIYRAIYGITAIELETKQLRALRTGRTRRKPRRAPDQRRTRFATGKHISERAAEAAERTVPGHWEGDTIVGEGTRSAVGTLADRCTRYVRLIPLHDGKTGEHMSTALTAVIESMPDQLRKSITWDQGSEMACHDKITQNTGVPIYFCDRASPWQRPTNENTNGLLRQYMAKGTDLYTAADAA